METLVAVDQRRNQYYGRVKSHDPARFGSSPPSRQFREINCRTFQSGAGILPTPSTACTSTVAKHTLSPLALSTVTLSQSIDPDTSFVCADNLSHKTRSSPIPIIGKFTKRDVCLDGEVRNWNENGSFSELWAGPAYSNSPPPSSLPIPKFSMKPKRTVSLNLPAADTDVKVHPFAKSAPASPTSEHNSSMLDLLFSADSATKTLRRILNLDADE